ncbi:hypothetical protein SFRURICE_013424 [Spodoptera frugiperda]|nr:hypothetical protein SFRURICE_013424 [Spodoptera frugiperda]
MGFIYFDNPSMWLVKVSVHKPALYASYAFRTTSARIACRHAVRTMRISGRSCMSFYTRQTKIHCVRCGPVDAYLLFTFIYKYSSTVWTPVRGRYAARVCDVSIVRKPSIAHIFPYKKHNLAEAVSTSAKLCVPMNMIGGSRTHPQQRSITPSLVEKQPKAEHICIST